MKFSKFRHLLLVIGMAGFASPALAQDEERQSCEPAYAVDLAEVAAGVRAKLVADTFKGLADELAAEAGELDSASHISNTFRSCEPYEKSACDAATPRNEYAPTVRSASSASARSPFTTSSTSR